VFCLLHELLLPYCRKRIYRFLAPGIQKFRVCPLLLVRILLVLGHPLFFLAALHVNRRVEDHVDDLVELRVFDGLKQLADLMNCCRIIGLFFYLYQLD
jgi:hypothetical protein